MKKIPVGVKVISVLYFLIALVFLGFGLLMTILAKPMHDALPELAAAYNTPAFATISIWVVIGIGLAFLAVSTVSFFVGLGLWKGKKWARTLAVIFAILEVVQGITGIFQESQMALWIGISHLVVGGLILAYLSLNKKVKRIFS